MHPGKFKYILNRDPGVSGNLEINIRKSGGKFTQVHTKQGGEGYPNKNWSAFHTRLENGIKSC